jgi:hypothetical protein
MPKSTTFANDFVALTFNAAAIANIADNAAGSPLTSLYVSLHTATPGIGGSQLTNETAYTNYTRIAVTRASGAGGWTVALGVANNTSTIAFPTCGASGATITHVAIGTASSGAGKVLYAGALNDNLIVSNLSQPQFAPTTLTATET